jgi:hypothetical protein
MFLAGLFLFSERALRHVDVIAVTFYSNVGSVPVMIGGGSCLEASSCPRPTLAGWPSSAPACVTPSGSF